MDKKGNFKLLELRDAAPPDDAEAAPVESPAPHRYEDLEGGEGRAVFFRPHRHTARDLAPLEGTVALTIDGVRRDCAVLDVSQNGVAVAWPQGVPVRRGKRADAVLRFDGHQAFSGPVRIGSVRESADRTVVGLSFENFLLDVDDLLSLRTLRAWATEAGSSRVQEKPWGVADGERFQARVAELRMVLEDARDSLDALERQLPWHGLHGAHSPVLPVLERSLRTRFVPEFVRLTEAVDAEIRRLPGAHGNERARQWVMRHVQEHLMQSPGLRRAYEKPFGYPGDYEVMNATYERFFDGATLFARAVGLGFSETLCSKAVRFRKDLVKRQLKALVSRRAGAPGPVRVLSIGAGPAQELHELVRELDDLPVPLEVVLFEQDKNALAHAFRRLTPSVEARFPGRMRLVFLHDSIKRLLRDETLFAPFGKFDLIYSVGLLDYLQHRTGVVLTRHLARAAAPGGQVLVANMVDHASRTLLQIHLDWALIYRTREELLDIARSASPGAQVRILEEESGVNPFFELVHG
ncbi:MAG TPA: class I SAM-dependent methyltransferase [Anaeromyxobacteraceae bacterium]|nr:class I SAM-dependent methyltransferase [Anaeromyxobacteraceae bacterium]